MSRAITVTLAFLALAAVIAGAIMTQNPVQISMSRPGQDTSVEDALLERYTFEHYTGDGGWWLWVRTTPGQRWSLVRGLQSMPECQGAKVLWKAGWLTAVKTRPVGWTKSSASLRSRRRNHELKCLPAYVDPATH